MSSTVKEKTAGILTESVYHPSVCIMLPASLATEAHLQRISGQVEKEILTKYKREKCEHLTERLNHAIKAAVQPTNKQSIAMLVTPVYEAVVHIDMPLTETVMVDEPFEVRDLADKMTTPDKYLVLLQSGKAFKILLGDNNSLVKLNTDQPENITAYKNDLPEKIENFTNNSERKEVMMDKFIVHIDKELGNILKKYPLPVFVIGTDRMNGHFKQYTHHIKNIAAYIHGNYENVSNYQLSLLLQPYLENLKEKAKEELQRKMQHALDANKLVYGIDEVWQNVRAKKGQILIVERGYYYPHILDEGGNLKSDAMAKEPVMKRDAVDVLIEMILDNGGEVKFTDEGYLKDYKNIALIEYYSS